MKLILILTFYLSFQMIYLKNNVIIKSNRINIEIDASQKVGQFNEKVLYNLEIDNNELKSVSLNKTLPQIDSQIFDLKVTSNDVKILKYEIVDDKNNFNKNRKILNIVFDYLDEKNFNQGKNSNQGMVNIEYSYKVKDLVQYKEYKSVKSSFFLKDVGIFREKGTVENNEPYPTKYSIAIKNLPENVKVKRVEYDNSEIEMNEKERQSQSDANEFKIRFERLFDKNNLKKENKNIFKKLRFVLDGNVINKPKNSLKQSSSVVTHIPSDRSDSTNSTDQNGKKYTYYNKKSNDAHHQPSVWETVIAALMVLGICYLCFCCCMTPPTDQAHHDKAEGHDMNQGNNNVDGMAVIS